MTRVLISQFRVTILTQADRDKTGYQLPANDEAHKRYCSQMQHSVGIAF